MSWSRGSLGLNVAAAVLAWAATTVAVWAQPATSQITGLLNTTTSLNAQQQQLVTGFVDSQAEQFQSAQIVDLVKARDNLLDIWARQPSPQFLAFYEPLLAGRLTPLLKSSNLLLRLNVMIAASHMTQAGTLPLALQGLNDDNSAVRYWAGKMANSLGMAKKMTPAEEEQLLGVLTAQVVKEDNRFVVQQLLSGMGSLNVPQAGVALLQALDHRLAGYVKDRSVAPVPEAMALDVLFAHVAMSLGAVNTARLSDENRQTLQTALSLQYRYTLLAARAMTANPAPADTLAQDYINILNLGDKWMNWAAGKLAGKSGDVVHSFSAALKGNQWANVLLILQDDVAKDLTSPPVNLPADAVKLP